LVPFTTWEAEIFPAKIFLHDLKTNQKRELSCDPSRQFLAVLDLERGKLVVQGKELALEKMAFPPCKKRLFLGVHKKQDWEMIERRGDLAEIFPFWVRLAQIIPKEPLPKQAIGTMQLLAEGRLAHFFQSGFVGMLCPRFRDEHFFGHVSDFSPPKDVCPLGLIHEGARQIEDLFFQENEDVWHILPSLPKEFHAGKFVHLVTELGDEIDLEWSKKQIKKMIIRPRSTRVVHFKLKGGLKSFRLRKSSRQKGSTSSLTLHLQEGQTLYLDRFKTG
jgi:hypothetical protein